MEEQSTGRTFRAYPTLADAFRPEENAFGFLRLALALLVVFYHCYPLGGFGLDPLQRISGGRHTFGSEAVAAFFVLSGFLVARSGVRCSSVRQFLWHRFLRVYPGYWVCLLFCAFIIAPVLAFLEFGSVSGLFSVPRNSPQTFVLHNAALFHLNGFSVTRTLALGPESIAALLKHNPTPRAINGSLWTLAYEFTCYLGLAALVAANVLRRARWVVLSLFTLLLLLYTWNCLAPHNVGLTLQASLSRELVRLSLFFSTGAVAFLYRERIPCSKPVFFGAVVVTGLAYLVGPFNLLAPLGVAYVSLWLAVGLPFTRLESRVGGDYSYGVYIYAFPIQQLLATLHLHEEGFAVYFSASLLGAVTLAFFSYRCIEAPCLRLKNLNLFKAVAFRPGSHRETADTGTTGLPSII